MVDRSLSSWKERKEFGKDGRRSSQGRKFSILPSDSVFTGDGLWQVFACHERGKCARVLCYSGSSLLALEKSSIPNKHPAQPRTLGCHVSAGGQRGLQEPCWVFGDSQNMCVRRINFWFFQTLVGFNHSYWIALNFPFFPNCVVGCQMKIPVLWWVSMVESLVT